MWSLRLPVRGYGNGQVPLYVHHPSSLEHDTGPHPENANRVRAIEAALEREAWLGLERVEAPAATRDQLLRVHPAEHVERIRRLSEEGGGMIDMDTVVSAGSWEAALHAAGGAVHAVDRLLGDGAGFAFGGLRPPGHHAETARAMGFCLFNNVAVAARRALDRWGAERVLILDWDVHHGNGTNDIFHRDPDVLYVSIHESPLYPGTGPAADAGSGPGEGYTVNLPVPAGSGDAVWCSLVEHVVVALGLEYRPGLVLISAGFDAHLRDPLAGCRVTREGYAQMAASMRALADELDVPVGVVLEGGYDLEALAESTVATLEVVGATEVADRPPVALHPLAAQAAGRLAERWPLVGVVAG
jgi:acetoin utilization deacetylase AcuC-like enzyme